MNYNHLCKAFVMFLLMVCTTKFAFGQLFVSYKKYAKPSVILVKLPTYSNKVVLYNNAKNDKYAKQIKEDAINMQQEIIKDFNTNFKFCNYYFFYDTAQDAILKQHFAGNLYDKNMLPVSLSPISENDTSYQIAYFGYYVSEFSNPHNPKKGKENTYNTGSKLQRLVLLNRQFNRIPDPIPNGTNYDDRYTFARFQHRLSNTYRSKLFDIYYTTYAHFLSLQMNNYYNKKNVK